MISEIKKSVLKKVKPTSQENKKQQEILNSFKKEFLSEYETVFGGSLQKNTNLKNKEEADVFVRLTELKQTTQLKKNLAKLKVRTLKGSRDIYQVNYKGLKIEIVPTLKILKEVAS